MTCNENSCVVKFDISGNSEFKQRGSPEGEERDRVMLSKRRITCYVTAESGTGKTNKKEKTNTKYEVEKINATETSIFNAHTLDERNRYSSVAQRPILN